MKKFTTFLSALMLTLVLMVAPVYAGAGFDVNSGAAGGGIDYDGTLITGGAAGGISGAFGTVEAGASGGIIWGSAGGWVDTIGGGITNTNTDTFNPGFGTTSIGIGSYSENQAVTGFHSSIYVDGVGGMSSVYGSGFAAQGTLNGSCLDETSIGFTNSDGFTGGAAGQGSIGGFAGGAYVGTIWGDADASLGANIEMNGYSYSDSYAYIDVDGNSITEGMGTFVLSSTNVEAFGYGNINSSGLAGGDYYGNGGYSVIGGAGSVTVQDGSGGSAYASCGGVYAGGGNINSSYNGSAAGYTHTSIMTLNGMNGSIVHSLAGMHVSSE